MNAQERYDAFLVTSIKQVCTLQEELEVAKVRIAELEAAAGEKPDS